MSIRLTADTLVLPGSGRRPNLHALLADITTKDTGWKRTGTVVAAPRASEEPEQPLRRRAAFLLADTQLESPVSRNGSDGDASSRMPDDNTPHPNLRRRHSIFSRTSREGSAGDVRSDRAAEDDSSWVPETTHDKNRSLMGSKKSSRRLRKHLAAVEAAQRLQLANVNFYLQK
jgi:hypothetical protein